MKKIIFATNNNGKINEVKMMLSNTNIDIITLKEAGIEIDIEETGNTFEENAIIKAEAVMKMTGEAVIADDSGLEVDYLDKKPGIYSARFLGEDTSYDIKNKYIIDQLDGVMDEKRSARFVCAFAFAVPSRTTITKTGVIEGRIAYQCAGENGFGYDPIFYVPEYEKTTAELSPDIKNEISHRGRALKKLREDIIAYIS